MKIALILLAGGQSTRMGGPIPKTFLTIKGRPLIRYSFDLLTPLFPKTIVVAPKPYHHLFPSHTQFAEPGLRRQDSVKNGFQDLQDFHYILIHDGARPLIKKEDVQNLIEKGLHHPAAALAAPVKNTLKRTRKGITETIDRTDLWETYTPQLIRSDLLKQGLELNIPVTDELTLVEALGHNPLLVPCIFPNIKLTYPSDLPLIEALL